MIWIIFFEFNVPIDLIEYNMNIFLFNIVETKPLDLFNLAEER